MSTEVAADSPELRSGPGGFFFDAGLRCGWEARDVHQFCTPFPIEEPRLEPALTPAETSELNALRDRVAHVEANRPHFIVRLILGAVVGTIVGPPLALISDGLFVIGYFGAIAIVILTRPRLYFLSRELAEAERRAEYKAGQAQQRFGVKHREWLGNKAQHDVSERFRVERDLAWYGVVRPERLPERVNIYGGTAAGWQALVTTVGASLLAGGRRVIVLDLSQREVPARLLTAALEAGYTVDETVLPRDQGRLEPFAGLTADDTAALLAEALNEAETGDRQIRNLDIRILQRVCRVLAPNLSMARLAAGLRVLLDEEDVPAEDSTITVGEYDELSRLMSTAYRTNPRLFERMMLLEADIAALDMVGSTPAHRVIQPAQMQFMSFSRHGAAVNDLYLELLVQLQIRRLRAVEATTNQSILIIAGAERLRDRHLGEFDRLAGEIGATIVCLFDRYGDYQRKSTMRGDVATGFMALSDAEDAAAAADQIGTVERFILSQVGTTNDDSTSETWSFGESQGTTHGDSYSTTRTISSERGGSTGKSHGTSESYALQQRHEVEARDLRAAKHTDLYLVMWQRRGKAGTAALDSNQRHVWYADCDPLIALDPHASQKPFELTT